MARLSPEVFALRDDILALRRDLHRHPELAWEERRTAEQITSFLRGSRVELRTGLGGTGVLAEVKGDPSRTLLLRRSEERRVGRGGGGCGGGGRVGGGGGRGGCE